MSGTTWMSSSPASRYRLDSRSPSGTSGRFMATNGLKVHVGDRSTVASTLEGHAAFNGVALTLDDAVIEAPEARIAIDGRIDLLTAERTLDLGISANVRLDRAAQWVSVDPKPSGTIALEGRVSGAAGDPQIAVDLSGDGLAWHDITNVSLRAGVSGSVARVSVDSLAVRLAGGSIDGTAEIRMANDDQDHQGEARFQWQNLDGPALLSAFVPDPPVRVAALLDGDLAARWSGRDPRSLTLAMHQTSRGAGRRGAVSLAGNAALDVSSGVWTLEHDHQLGSIQVSGSSHGRLDDQNLGDSTLAGRASIGVRDLARAADDIDQAGVDLPASLTDLLSGRLAAQVTLTGTLRAPAAELMLDVTDVMAGSTGPGTATAQMTLTSEGAHIRNVEAFVGANRLQGWAAVNWDGGSLDGRLSGDLTDLGAFGSVVPAAWRPAGSLVVEATLGGTTEHPLVTAAVQGDGNRDRWPARRSSDCGSESRRILLLTIDEIIIDQASGSLAARGRYDFSNRAYAIRCRGRGTSRCARFPEVPPEEARNPKSRGGSHSPDRTNSVCASQGEGTIDATCWQR